MVRTAELAQPLQPLKYVCVHHSNEQRLQINGAMDVAAHTLERLYRLNVLALRCGRVVGGACGGLRALVRSERRVIGHFVVTLTKTARHEPQVPILPAEVQ